MNDLGLPDVAKQVDGGSSAAVRGVDQLIAPLMIRASAGTGKTFQLSNRYLQLVLTGHPAERILATTFTRKAAGEILGRILIRLAEATKDPEHTAKLAAELRLPDLTLNDCQRALRQLTSQLHRLRVATLDSFFLQATQTLSLDLGLPPSWRILDEADELPLREAAIAAMLKRQKRAEVIQLLRNLAHGDTHRSIRRQVSQTIDALYSVYLDSRQEAWNRLPRLTGLEAAEREQLANELASWLSRFEGDSRLKSAVESVLIQVRNEDWDAATKSTLLQRTVDGDATYYSKPVPEALVPLLDKLVKHVRSVIQNRVVLQTEASYELLQQFHKQFDTLKAQRRVLRFDDLARCLGELEQSRQWTSLSFRLDSSVESLLLDEFQDTSLSQWRVLEPFARHACCGGPHRSFLCVGDAKQAIYGWRGGDAELMDAMVAELGSLREETLGTSYRSSQVVIDVVNRINRQMDRHKHLEKFAPAVKQWVQRFPKHATSREDYPGYVTLETSPWATGDKELLERTIQLAAERVADVRSQAPHRSVAVLVRTNDCVAQTMHALQQLEIPASEEGGNPLTDAAGVQLILSLLVLADHPQDLAARFHVVHSPLGPVVGLTSLEDSLAAQQLSRRVHRALADRGYGEVVQSWVDQLKPFSNVREWRRLNQLAELAYRYQQQVEAPRDVGYHQQQSLPLCTEDFVRRVGQQRISDPTEDPVRVMTVHQAKGLQFDVVVLPQLNHCWNKQPRSLVTSRPHATEPIDTVMPWVKQEWRKFLPDHVQRLHEQHEIEQLKEELCVLYVALTRAVYSLQMIVWPDTLGENDESNGTKVNKRKTPSKECKLPTTMAGLIRAALTDGESLAPRARIKFGDPQWIQRVSIVDERTASQRPGIPRRVKLRSTGSAAGAGAERLVRPSRLEGGGRVDLTERLSLVGQAAMERGTLIHAFFEQIEWLDDTAPTAAALQMLASSLDADAAQRDRAITDFQTMLNCRPMREILSRTHYQHWWPEYGAGDPRSLRLEVRREQPLNVRDGDEWLSGTIDRLVVLYRRGRPVAADILDFKTDSNPTPASRKQRVEYYRPQLRAYRRGVSRMLKLDTERISTRLLFVVDGYVVDLTPTRGGV